MLQNYHLLCCFSLFKFWPTFQSYYVNYMYQEKGVRKICEIKFFKKVDYILIILYVRHLKSVVKKNETTL